MPSGKRIQTLSMGTTNFHYRGLGDGTLSQIDTTPTNELLRSVSREILLPLNALDEIKGYAEWLAICLLK